MKVMHYFEPNEGNLLLDISTKEKEAAGYLYMFRYITRHPYNYTRHADYEKTIEAIRIEGARTKQEMKELVLLHGKDAVRIHLQDKRRRIKDGLEAIENLGITGPLFAAAKKGDAKAAVRLLTDMSLKDNPFLVCRRNNDHISKLKVLDPRRLTVPKPNELSPSVILDPTTGKRT